MLNDTIRATPVIATRAPDSVTASLKFIVIPVALTCNRVRLVKLFLAPTALDLLDQLEQQFPDIRLDRLLVALAYRAPLRNAPITNIV
jgi:hypothetical protein